MSLIKWLFCKISVTSWSKSCLNIFESVPTGSLNMIEVLMSSAIKDTLRRLSTILRISKKEVMYEVIFLDI